LLVKRCRIVSQSLNYVRLRLAALLLDDVHVQRFKTMIFQSLRQLGHAHPAITVLLVTFFSLIISAVSAQTARPAGSLSAQSAGHSATLLYDGSVLVVTIDGRTERYVPSTNQWILTAGMIVGGSGHTSTRLLNGNVLVVGGAANSTPFDGLARAEVFDPADSSWSSATPMLTARTEHTATLLNDGTVLVVGGDRKPPFSSEVLNSVERYSASPNSWTAGPPVPVPIVGHTATRLNSGDVLVLGGATGSNGPRTNTCIRFVVTSNTWVSCTSLPSARTRHRSILLPNGKVLVTGGLWTPDVSGKYADVYDPETNSWQASMMPEALSEGIALVRYATNSVLKLGGTVASGIASQLIGADARYFQETSTYKRLSMSGRINHTATTLADGRVLVVGGIVSFRTYDGLGLPITVPVLTADAFIYGKQDTQVEFTTPAFRTPYVPEVGERYRVAAQIRTDQFAPFVPAPTGTISVSDGSAMCAVGTPFGGSCALTTFSAGAKIVTAIYGGDAEYQPSTATYTATSDNAYRLSVRGSGSGSVRNAVTYPLTTSGVCPAGTVPLVVVVAIGCVQNFAPGTAAEVTAGPSAGSGFTGWLGACSGMATNCAFTVPTTGPIDLVATFAPIGDGPFTLDIDKDGKFTSTTDGVLLSRFIKRLHDDSLISKAIGSSATRTDASAVDTYLENLRPILDVDGDGWVELQTDAVMILRYLLGFRGQALLNATSASGARRTLATEIELYMAGLTPRL
jgi:hypothetical protein